MIHIAICDDTKEFTTYISNLLDQWEDSPEPLVTQIFTNGDSLLNAHAKRPFDIILQDIVMPALSGLDIAREIRKTDSSTKIVFLTSSPEFAIDSYSVKATNYLLKPVTADALYQCLGDIISGISKRSPEILIRSSGMYHRVPLSSIEYIEAQNKYVHFVLSGGKIIKASDTFSRCQETLLKEQYFIKCHRSYIVNLFKVRSFSGKELYTHSGVLIPISRSYQKDFEASYFAAFFERTGEHNDV